MTETVLTSPERRNLNATLSDAPIYKFVITGGPCAGKTTAMERLQVFLRERGFRVFVVPEAATMLFVNGASPDDLASEACQSAFQQFVINTQMQLEDSMMTYAKSVNAKAVILCDRGIMDGSAYVSKEIWQGVLEKAKLDIVSAREGRYDAIFHLVTAADGAEAFYTLANNKARHESVPEAIRQDKKTQEAWQGHPHHVIIDNRDHRAFERKMELLVSMLAGYVGLPSVTRRSHKFSLAGLDGVALQAMSDLNVQVFDVEKIMLEEWVGAIGDSATGVRRRRANSSIGLDNGDDDGHDVDGSNAASATAADSLTESAADTATSTEGLSTEDVVLYSFIRRRSVGAFHAYGLTTVKRLPSGELVELKQVISARMYAILSNSADPRREIVRQKRYCFQWERQSFHVYEYLHPKAGIYVLHCQSESEPEIPPFLHVGPELTMEENRELSSRTISLRDVTALHLSKDKDLEKLRQLSQETEGVFSGLNELSLSGGLQD